MMFKLINMRFFAFAILAALSLPLAAQSATQSPEMKQTSDRETALAAVGNPHKLVETAKTVCVLTKTEFVSVDSMHRALQQQKEWSNLGLVLVQDKALADLVIEIDHTVFTYAHTFVIVDRRTTIVLGSGKSTAFNGSIAAGRLAGNIVKFLAVNRTPPQAKQ